MMVVNEFESYWQRATIEVRAAGFDPTATAEKNTIFTIAWAHTNAHRCNNRVERISDLLCEALEARGGQGLVVGLRIVSLGPIPRATADG